MGYCSDRY